MKVEIRERWASALRSGRFKPAKGAECLHRGHGAPSYCAFGVLVKLAEEETGLPLFCELPGERNEMCAALIGRDRWAIFEPWAGMVGARYGWSQDGRLVAAVLAANDAGATFEAIAEMVEAG